MVILCDMDGVVANFVDPVIARYNRDYNDNITADDITGWDMHKACKPECGTKLYEYFCEKGLFAELPVIADSQRAFTYLLKQGHEIYFVTKPVARSQWCILEKMQWVDRHFPMVGRENMVFTSMKHLVRGDVLIDDHEKNLYTFPGHKILVDSPWNRHTNDAEHGFIRKGSWVDIVKTLSKLA